LISQTLRTKAVSIESVEGKICQLFMFVTRNFFLKHPSQNIRLLVASVIVHLMPHCAHIHENDDFDGNTWKDDIDTLFHNRKHVEVGF